MPTSFETAEEDVWVMGALVEINERRLADSIEQSARAGHERVR